MQIEVTNCAECPFRVWHEHMKMLYCRLNSKAKFIKDESYEYEVHPLCPLKQQPITVKLAENGNNNE